MINGTINSFLKNIKNLFFLVIILINNSFNSFTY